MGDLDEWLYAIPYLGERRQDRHVWKDEKPAPVQRHVAIAKAKKKRAAKQARRQRRFAR